jgi:hypothetical protein
MKFEQNRIAGSALADLPVLASRARRALLCVATLLPGVFAWGCAGFVSGQNSPPPPPQTYSISGTISPVTGGNGATVTLSGGASTTTTANSSGSYTFTGLANGSYTITPSRTGYTFAPTSQNATVNGANVTGLNFTATKQTNPTFSISGTISPAAGSNGATVTLSGAASATTTANNSGNYTFSGVANGNYAVTPSHAGYTFSSTTQAVSVNGANVTGLNFTATANPTFSIFGTISPIAGGSGATVVLSGAAGATTVANSSGNYSFAGLASGTYLVTPANTGYSFSPVNQSVTISAANVNGVNFTATAQVTHTVALTWNASTSPVAGYNVYRSTVSGTGYARINSSLVAVFSYTDSNVLNGTTYYYVTTAVDSTGVESTLSNEASAVIP